LLAPFFGFGPVVILRPSLWSIGIFVFGLVGSLLIGGGWAFLTRKRERRRRIFVVGEVVVLGYLYPLVLAAGLLAVRAVMIGVERGWDVAARSLDDGQVLGSSSLLAASSVLVTPFVGLAFSLIAFERSTISAESARA
jgi:hypothetical protein